MIRFSFFKPDRMENAIPWTAAVFKKVQQSLNAVADGEREVRHNPPEKPTLGMMVFADGTDWNPGGGIGTYEYTGLGTNGWRLLATGTQY